MLAKQYFKARTGVIVRVVIYVYILLSRFDGSLSTRFLAHRGGRFLENFYTAFDMGNARAGLATLA
jgi:hypothetical protein